MEHKAATKFFHLNLSCAIYCASPQGIPISVSSVVTVLRQVVFGLPRFRLPCRWSPSEGHFTDTTLIHPEYVPKPSLALTFNHNHHFDILTGLNYLHVANKYLWNFNRLSLLSKLRYILVIMMIFLQ